MAAKYLLTTLGCKVNQYESQQLRELLDSLGLQAAIPGEIPDLAVVNTCAVTANASRKSRQTLRRLSHDGRTKVVAVGCAVSEDGEALRRLPGVDAVFGHDSDIGAGLHEFVLSLGGSRWQAAPVSRPDVGTVAPKQHGAKGQDGRIIAAGSAGSGSAESGSVEFGPKTSGPGDKDDGELVVDQILPRALPLVKENPALVNRIDAFAGHQRAFLKVQDGCDAFCTYCIIPRLRPTLRWKPVAVVVDEARALVNSGHREIVLTGIFLGAYGRETAIRKRFRDGRSPLATLIDALAGVEGLARLRLSSLEPGDVDDALLDVLQSHECCVPHLHLPLQAGSEDVLRRMNRQYTRSAFLDMIDRVYGALDRPAITTDIIVGFPGETEDDFQRTLAVAEYTEFAKIHAFPFSSREGTAAARWQKDFVHGSVIRSRMKQLAEIERRTSFAFRRQFMGTIQRVLVESADTADVADLRGVAMLRGRTDRYFEVHVETPAATPRPLDDGSPRSSLSPGDLLDVRIDRVTPNRTLGTPATTDFACVPLSVLS